MAAGQINAVFAVLYPVDYMLVAFGVALILLGFRTWKGRIAKEEPNLNAYRHYY